MNKRIERGTRVAVATTNGGAGVYRLEWHYAPSFAVSLLTEEGHHFTIPPERLKTIEPILEQ